MTCLVVFITIAGFIVGVAAGDRGGGAACVCGDSGGGRRWMIGGGGGACVCGDSSGGRKWMIAKHSTCCVS